MKSTILLENVSENSVVMKSFDRLVNLASVYRIAAGGIPSIEPKFPCGFINGYRNDQYCPNLTRDS